MRSRALLARPAIGDLLIESLSGCVFAIDTSRSTITESSNAISQIDDLSGLGHHLTQATGSKKPTKNTDSTSGLTAASFDGGDVLEAADHADLDLTSNFTIYIAGDFTSMPAYGYILSKSSTSDTGYYCLVSGDGTALRVGASGNSASVKTGGGLTGRHVIAATCDGSLGSANIKTWWDGTAAGTVSIGGAAATTNTLCIGAARAAADYAVTANLFVVALYNQTHSSSTVTNTCAALKARWATS